MVPLLELMTNKAMKNRHWNRMAEVTGHVFDIEGDNFTLRNILEAPLLEFKEDIEVLTYSYIRIMYILMHLRMYHDVWLDNGKNLRR